MAAAAKITKIVSYYWLQHGIYVGTLKLEVPEPWPIYLSVHMYYYKRTIQESAYVSEWLIIRKFSMGWQARFALDQHSSPNYCSSSLLKQQSAVRPAASSRHINPTLSKDELEDIKGVIRIRKSKDRQHKKPDLQNITHKTKDRETRTPLKPEGELRCSGRVGSSWSKSGTRRVTLVANPVVIHE